MLNRITHALRPHPSPMSPPTPTWSKTGSLRIASTPTPNAGALPTGEAHGENVSISPLARRLCDAISSARESYTNASQSELRAIVKRTQDNVLMGDWRHDALKDDKDIAEGADDTRHEISRRAADFIELVTRSSPPANFSRNNPFFGLDRTELAAIQYDETGNFSSNERRAASWEAGRQHGEWSEAACERAAKERALTGRNTNVLREILGYYEALPAIEHAAAPEGYADRLRADIASTEKDDGREWPDWLTMLLHRHGRIDRPMKHPSQGTT